MAVDIATLGIKVDATSVDDANPKLDQLAQKGDNAERAVKGLGNSSKALQAAMAQVVSAINGNTKALNDFAVGAERSERATKGAANAADDMANRVAKLRASVDPLGVAQDRVNDELREAQVLFEAGAIDATQYANALTILNARNTEFSARQAALNTRLNQGARAAKFTAAETLNLSRQFADIGVTAAMGMNPLMILIQQGPQIADVLGTARARGVGTAQAFREMGKQIMPFIRVLGPLALAVGAVGIAFHRMADDGTKSLKEVQKEFGFTEGQMKRLKDSNEDLTQTMGDQWYALKETTKDVITDAIGPQLEAIRDWFADAFDAIGNTVFKTVRNIVGMMTAAVYAIRATWRMLPAAMADIMNSVANAVVNGVSSMVNKSIDGINSLIGMLPDWVETKTGKIDYRMGSNLVSNPYAGASDNFGAAGRAAAAEGYDAGVGYVDQKAADFRDYAEESRRNRLTGAAGDAEKGLKPKKPPKAKESEAEKEYKKAIEGAREYIKALGEETAEIGKNRMELKELATQRAIDAVMKVGDTKETRALAAAIREQHEAWEDATNREAARKMAESLADENAEIEFQNSLIGMNNAQREVAIKKREIELKRQADLRDGLTYVSAAVDEETKALLANAEARGKRLDAMEAADRTATAMRDTADAVRETTESFGELFGTAGEGFANLLNVILDFDARQAESRARLLRLQEEYNDGSISGAEYEFERGRIADEMSRAQIAQYGNMIGAAKTFFKEGSTGWKVMEAAERAFRIFQFAMQIRAMLMDRAQTASSVANSGARAAADGVAAVAKAIASLPFPLNIAAGAATAAMLVAFGVKLLGGGKGKSASATASSGAINEAPYNGPRDEYGAPTSSYSVLKPGQTTVAGIKAGGGANGFSGGVSIGDTTLIIQGGADRRTVEETRAMLDQHKQNVVMEARQLAAQDRAAAASRQSIGGA